MTKQMKQQEILNLMAALSSNSSKIGDWKVIKIYEARLRGEEDPYDAEELMHARQEIRDQINALQTEVATMEDEMTEIEIEDSWWVNQLIDGTKLLGDVPDNQKDGVKAVLMERVQKGIITAEKYAEITGEVYAE